MALIKTINGLSPKFGENCFLAENATIIGDVNIGNDCSIWFNVVIRGDVNSINIGNKVNIQDGCVLHCLYKRSVIDIGDNVTVGHNAIIHGARINNNVLIGMGSIIMDNSVIGESSIIAAGSLILENSIIEPFSVYGGVPAKKIKEVDPETLKRLNNRTAENYLLYASWYKEKKE
jgi:carbonic anhydrase/acetyltransferase-like protein (isoleucine patch superfamily)